MSDETRDMTCEEAIEHLYSYLDRELTADTEAAVRAHLAACRPCLGHATFEEAFLRFVEARGRAAEAPASLRKKILEQLLFDSDTPPSHP